MGAVAGFIAAWVVLPAVQSVAWQGPAAMIVDEVEDPTTHNLQARIVSSAPFDCNTTIYTHNVPSLPFGKALLECRDGQWQVSSAPVTPKLKDK
jgi:hypothetical protein